MNAIALLETDHKKLKKLLKQVSKTSTNDTEKRQQLFALIKEEATLHETMEEKFLYPYLKDFKKSRTSAFEHFQEVALMKHLLTKLSRSNVNTEEWNAMFTVFKELNDHHIEEEEQEYFPQAQKLLSEDLLEEIGVQMRKYKKERGQV